MFKVKRPEIVISVVSLVFVTIFFKNQLVNLFKTDFNAIGYYYSNQFDLDMRWTHTDNLAQIGAKVTERPEAILYTFPKRKTDRVYLKFLFGIPYADNNEKYKNLKVAEIFNNFGYRKQFNYSNLNIGYTIVDITDSLLGQSDFNIHLKALPSEYDKYSELAVRRIEVSVLPESKNFLPNLSLIITAIIIPFILFHCFGALGFSNILCSIFSFISLAVYLISYNLYPDFLNQYHLFLLLIVYLFYSLIVQRKKMDTKYGYLFLLIILLVVAIHLRWSEIQRLSFAVPHPDASHPSDGLGYKEYADHMKLFTKDGFFAATKVKQTHEPFYPFVAKLFFAILGSSDLHLRFVSFFFSIIAVLMTYFVGREFFKNKNIALLSSGIVSVNSYLIEQSSMGLRLELEICLFLALFYFCYLKRETLKNWFWIIISGAIGGLWLLTKSYNIVVILFIFGYVLFGRKDLLLIKKIISFILVSILAVSFLLPYKFNLYRSRSDPLSDAWEYTTGSANIEFSGQPSFPRKKVTLGEYYFKLHTPAQLVGYHLLGAGGIFYFLSEEIFNVINEQNHLFKVFMKDRLRGLFRYPFLTLKIMLSLLLMIFAVLLCLSKSNLRLIIYMVILGCFANLFVYGVAMAKGIVINEPHRTIAQVLPFVAFCIAYTINYIFIILIKPVLWCKKITTN